MRDQPKAARLFAVLSKGYTLETVRNFPSYWELINRLALVGSSYKLAAAVLQHEHLVLYFLAWQWLEDFAHDIMKSLPKGSNWLHTSGTFNTAWYTLLAIDIC